MKSIFILEAIKTFNNSLYYDITASDMSVHVLMQSDNHRLRKTAIIAKLTKYLTYNNVFNSFNARTIKFQRIIKTVAAL